jgi:hypothetical protein
MAACGNGEAEAGADGDGDGAGNGEGERGAAGEAATTEASDVGGGVGGMAVGGAGTAVGGAGAALQALSSSSATRLRNSERNALGV